MLDSDEALLEEKYDNYGTILFRLCMVLLGNQQDAEDAVQDTFVRYWKKRPVFQNTEHEKAWLIRVATNRSKDKLRNWFRCSTVGMDVLNNMATSEKDTFVLEQLFTLPSREKTVLFLHYTEGYKVAEIASILKISDNAVKAALYRGRKKLKLQLEEVPVNE